MIYFAQTLPSVHFLNILYIFEEKDQTESKIDVNQRIGYICDLAKFNFHKGEVHIFPNMDKSQKSSDIDIKATKCHMEPRCLLNLIKFIDLLGLQNNSRLINNDVQTKLTFLSMRTKPPSMLKY
jgi:hypothetical protein